MYKGTESAKSKHRVAIKKLPHKSAKAKKANWSEVYFLAKCDHSNIVHFEQVGIGLLSLIKSGNRG